jgi:hypothetical protein
LGQKDWQGKVWQQGETREGFRQLFDQDQETYVVVSPEERDARVMVGLEWDELREINGLRVDFAALNDVTLEPLPEHQHLEYLNGQEWLAVESKVSIDYGPQNRLSRFQKCGYVTWVYWFPKVQAKGIRLVMTRTPSPIRWEQQYVVREMQPYSDEINRVQVGKFQVVAKTVRRNYPADLLSSEYAPRLWHDGQDLIVEWSRPRLINEIRIPKADWSAVAESWTEESWRPVDVETVTETKNPPQVTIEFLPISVVKLRLPGVSSTVTPQICLNAGGRQYFQSVYESGPDLLMNRILESRGEPDLAFVRSLLLPLDMQTAVIGRPGDEVECMVHWNGTLVEIEGGDQGAWNTGAENSPPGVEKWIDRWFAFAVNNELIGASPESVSRSYIEDFMPGVITRHTGEGIEVEIEAFTTAPEEELYGQAVRVSLENKRETPAAVAFSVIMGRRRSALAASRRQPDGLEPGPMSFSPLQTGYEIDSTGRLIRNSLGEIVLFANLAGQWNGNERERILSYELQIPPRDRQQLVIVMPSVNAPVVEEKLVRNFNFPAARDAFEAFWQENLNEKPVLELPERGLNQLYKNLVAQALITLVDGEKLKYGAYWYEDYFGLEEGWPMVALAQFGHSEISKEKLKITLSPELLSKKNYHHQYRSGLALMYAAQVYRLTRDSSWLESVKPRLIETAEWIMSARMDDRGKSPEFVGLLPKHAYGGDIQTPAYSLYSNATCWRGLHDAGILMKELEEEDLSEKYLVDAREYRKRIRQLARDQLNRSITPPFLPLAWEIGSPGDADYKEAETPYPFIPSDPLGNYWSLFAPLMVETGVFPAESDENHWVTDFMEQRGALLSGLSRFYRGIDHIYGFGYPLQLLGRGEKKKFVATVYSILAHGLAADSFTGPEVGGIFPMRTDNAAFLDQFQRYLWQWDLYRRGWDYNNFGYSVGSEPLSAAAGVALQLLRALIVEERLNDEAESEETLDLLRMTPPHWLNNGKEIKVSGLTTNFGELDLNLRSQLLQHQILVDLNLSFEHPRKVVIWLNTADELAIRNVSVNGRPWDAWTANSVELPKAAGSYSIVVRF